MTDEQTTIGVPPHPRGPERWRVEITGLGGDPADRVRVTLIDAETGKRVGANELPFAWLRDVAHGGVALAAIVPGQWT